jgi:uncharacterized SAM-binding protein YcdF (DUF218 family)
MFFYFSKFLSFLFLPQGILLIVGILIYVKRKNHTKVKRLALFSIFLTYLFCNSLYVNFLAYVWEVPRVSIEEVEKHDYAVLLTGGLLKDSDNNIQLDISSDRLWKVLQLYQNQKINQIIISGGDKNPVILNENNLAKKFLMLNGVPGEVILQENISVNTFENALFTSKLIKKEHMSQKGILVSSSYHLKRAQACFRKQGLDFQLYPSGSINYNTEYNMYDILPQAKNFRQSELLMKEIFGYWVYQVKGYL